MFNKKLLGLALLSVAVFVGLLAYGDFRETVSRLANFPPSYLLAALALAAVNYLLRFLRWACYLKALHISLPLGASSLVFLSGLALSVTPGKVGELFKSYLLRSRAQVPVSVSAPAVVMERVTDVISVVLLGLTGLLLLPLEVSAVLGGMLLLAGGVLVFLTSRYSDRLVELPVLRRWDRGLLASRQGLRTLASPRNLLAAVALGAAAWLSEGVALWVILQGLGAESPILWALPIYAAATLVGAVTTLPGGLVGTEGSMVALLQQSGVGAGVASAGTLLVRLVTLWFAVLIGVAALAALHRLRPSPALAARGPGPEGTTGQAPGSS